MNKNTAFMEGNTGNKIISRAFNTYFIAFVADAVIHTVASLLDTALGGLLFDLNALVGVGICGMFSTFYLMVSDALCGGFRTNMGDLLGRGEVDKSNESFSIGLILNFIIGVATVLIALFFAEPIVYAFGARDPEVAKYAVVYIRFSSIANVLVSLEGGFRGALAIYGYKKTCTIKACIEMSVKLVASLIYVKVLGMGVEGLALGSITGTVCAFLYQLASYMYRPATLRLYLKITPEMLKQLPRALKYGLPGTVNQVGDFILGIALNNVIAITVGTSGLALFTLYKSIRSLTDLPARVSGSVLGTVGVSMYGARDVDGVKRAIKSAMSLPSVVTLAFSVAAVLLRVPLLTFFGAKTPEIMDAMLPALIWIVFSSLFTLALNVMMEYYNVTEHQTLSAVFSVGADFVIYLPLVIILMPLIGISATWVAYTFCYIIFFAIMLAVYAIKYKHLPRNLDDIALLPADYYDDSNLINVTLLDGVGDLGKLREVSGFLTDKGYDKRLANHCALCLEELITRMCEGEHKPKYIDLRLYVHNGGIRFSIRNDGRMNNCLVFEPKDEFDGIGIRIVRSIAESVSYNYTNGFNVLNVTV